MEMIPKAEPQKIPIQVFEESIPNDGKWEIEEGGLLFSDNEMRKVILMLIGQIGLKKLIEILPQIKMQKGASIHGDDTQG